MTRRFGFWVRDRLLASLDGTEGADTLTSGVGADLINGFGGDDRLLGRGGDDTLAGGGGTDTMVGGAGNDTYHVDLTGDVVTEVEDGGIDTVVVTASSHVLAAHVENLDGSSPGSFSRLLVGNDLGNVITGSGGGDLIIGGAGNDTLSGGLGDDQYQIENAGDVIIEAANAGRDVVMTDLAHYRMAAGVEDFRATGTTGQKVIGNRLDNEVFGTRGNDTMSGGLGDDRLFGQAGKDVLTGNGGADWFDFASAGPLGQVTRITDFDPGAGDQIGFWRHSPGQFAEFALGHLDPSLFKAYASPTEVDDTDRVLYDTTTGKLYFDQDGSGIISAVQFALLPNLPTLTAESFWVHL